MSEPPRGRDAERGALGLCWSVTLMTECVIALPGRDVRAGGETDMQKYGSPLGRTARTFVGGTPTREFR